MQINLKKWQDEILATLILAWPIILSNLAQMLINSTDVFLLGHYSEGALAASAIGTGIVITPLVIGYGLISASSAMIATQKGKMAHSVRDVRRSVRASMWIAILFSIPILANRYLNSNSYLGFFRSKISRFRYACSFLFIFSYVSNKYLAYVKMMARMFCSLFSSYYES